jgi:hypothetical protein
MAINPDMTRLAVMPGPEKITLKACESLSAATEAATWHRTRTSLRAVAAVYRRLVNGFVQLAVTSTPALNLVFLNH